MSTNASKMRKIRATGLSFAMTAAIGLIGASTALAPRPAQAVAFACVNCATWATQIPEYIAKIAHYAKEANGWKTQIQGMQDQIASVQNMQVALGLQSGQELQEIRNPKQFMVEERCGTQYGDGVGGIIGSLTGINLNGKVFEQQYKICAQRQWLQNQKYNVGVRYLKESMQQMQTDYRTMLSKFGAANNVGNSNKASQDAAAVLNKYQMQQQNHEQLIAAYDAAIESLDGQNPALARAALRGKAGYVRTVTSAAAAYTALCGGGKCSD